MMDFMEMECTFSHCFYTVPYFTIQKDPCIIVCSLIPGNPYPVIESPNDKNSLRGYNQLHGYQSHYVVTKEENGFPVIQEDYDNQQNCLFDEIVYFKKHRCFLYFYWK
jgi:hypothetical protein